MNAASLVFVVLLVLLPAGAWAEGRLFSRANRKDGHR